ncbi:glycosyltransferase [Mucilaginibacter lutimaris]|uniref:Glycosyltransferase n=1 Tax=Mucilaginibacter lutimaris TaxID=931629 RepID=A0ABW2ZIU1_9SPHI
MVIAISVVFFFLILRFTVTLFNFISNPKLPHIATRYSDLVSILIPARNEQDNILSLLESINDQNYNTYEVIILDDDSTDDTYNICQNFAETHPKFSVIKGQPLPPGWIGKNYACHQLAQQAKGRYLLFLDADEKINRDLINSAVHRMHLRGLGLLSLFTNQEMVTLGELSVVPLMHFVLINLLPLRLIYLVKKRASVAAASGQFMMFDAPAYHQNQWHKLVKNKVVEDVEIMKTIKAYGFNGEGLLANGMITCRMYKGYTEALDGFSKNFMAAFNYSIPIFLIYLLMLIGGPLFILGTGSLPLISLMVGLILLSRIMISFLSGQNALINLFLHPVQMLSLLLIGITSIQKHLTKTTVWKGRKI